MKLNQMKRYKRNQKRYNQKYKLKSMKKSSRKRDLSGKFLILLSTNRICTILKFQTKNVCITESALIVDKTFVKLISKSKIITSKINRKLLKRSHVKITKNYKQALMNLIERKPIQKTDTPPKKVTPVKIFSCKKCQEKFTTRSRLNFHYNHLHQLESEEDESSGSENELMIDEDVELVLEPQDEQCLNAIQSHTIKMEPLDTSLNSICDDEGRYSFSTNNESSLSAFHLSTTSSSTSLQSNIVKFTMSENGPLFCRICSASYSNRFFLDRHVTSVHILNRYRCGKCKDFVETKIKLQEHVDKHHSNEKLEYQNILLSTDNCVYQCCFCKYISKKCKNTVINHMREEHYYEFEKDEFEASHSSSPDSLSELISPESIIKYKEELAKSPVINKIIANEQTFRCVRCFKQFLNKTWLSLHLCKPSPFENNDKTPKLKVSNVVNGFYHCTYPKCSKVFTSKENYDEHTKICNKIKK